MITISEAMAAYSICARAEGKSPQTMDWILSSMRYFMGFLGGDRELASISADDLRRFILDMQGRHRFSQHRFAKPQPDKLSLHTIETYVRGIRAFFSNLSREGLLDENPMAKVKVPRVPRKVVPTFSDKEIVRLLAQPNKLKNRGFRDYTMLLIFIDTAARLSEVATLKIDDVDLEQGYLKVMGKGGRERYIPFGQKVAKALLKYKLKHRPEPVGTDHFFLAISGGELTPKRVREVVVEYGRQAGLKRCYPHKLRHTGAVLYLRNGGDPFSLQKKLGHSSLAMTRHYSNLADSDVRAQHLKYGVADKLKV